MGAVGAAIGITGPSDATLDSGFDLLVSGEQYVTPRVSVRGQFGGSWWDVENRGFGGSVKPVRFDANIVYNWEGGVWHPYVTTGPGVYHFHSKTGGIEGGDTDLGWNFGGGIEYFFHRRTTATGEILYHKVGAFNTPLARVDDGSFWSLDFGLKMYFGPHR